MSVSSVIAGGIGELGLRFFVVGIVPSIILVLFIMTLLWSGVPANPPDLVILQETIRDIDLNLGIFITVVVLVISLIMEPLHLGMIRLLEGYWGESNIAKILSNKGKKHHQKQYDDLNNKIAKYETSEDGVSENEKKQALGVTYLKLTRHYPEYRDRVLPTALGNILRAAEDNAGGRYGLNTIIVWPRLFALLPDKMQSILNDQRNQLDLTVRLCIVFLLCGAISLIFLYGYLLWWIMISAIMVFLAWLSYGASVASAMAYGEGIRTAFDLYRFDLLKALHIPLPSDPKSEKESNYKLNSFLSFGADAEVERLGYEHTTTEEKT